MKRNNFFFKLEEQSNGVVFWRDVFIQPLGENRTNVKNEDYDITPNFPKYFTNTKLSTKSLNNNEKETVFDILNNVGFLDMKYTEGLSSTRMKDAL